MTLAVTLVNSLDHGQVGGTVLSVSFCLLLLPLAKAPHMNRQVERNGRSYILNCRRTARQLSHPRLEVQLPCQNKIASTETYY